MTTSKSVRDRDQPWRMKTMWLLMGCFAGEKIEPMALPPSIDPCADAPASWIGTPAVHHVCVGAACAFPDLPKPYSHDKISVLFHGAEEVVRCRMPSGVERVIYIDKVACPCGAHNTELARRVPFSE